MSVKLAIVYYSTYGTNHQMAHIAAAAAREAGAEVRVLKVRETAPAEVVNSQDAWKAIAEATADVPTATPDDLVWANAYLFSAPTRYGSPASQMRAFIDTLGPIWQQGVLANKAFSAMTSAMNPHGGQETTLQSLYISAMHWGSILVPPGYTDPALYAAGGNPYGTSVTASPSAGVTPEIEAAIRHQTKRLVEVAAKLV
ncbi:MAG: NAD(P)H:quinone oxidoreductase [Rhodothermales bacterium]|nr:NAD(P)H:quinone oxidoreductase [Rhodothermales bacterium]